MKERKPLKPTTCIYVIQIASPVVVKGSIGKAIPPVLAKTPSRTRARLKGVPSDPTRVGATLNPIARISVALPVPFATPFGSALTTSPVVVSCALVPPHPILVTTRPDIALTDRPMGVGSLTATLTTATTAPIHGATTPRLRKLDEESWVLIHLRTIVRAAGTCTACTTRRKTVVAVDPSHLGLAAATTATCTLAAMLT